MKIPRAIRIARPTDLPGKIKEQYLFRWEIILVPVGLTILGFIRDCMVLNELRKKSTLGLVYLDAFTDWCNGEGRDDSLYDWMLHNTEAVHRMLGRDGYINLRRPFENGYQNNLPIIHNFIPEIQREFLSNRYLSNSISKQNLFSLIQMVDSCLRRFNGLIEERIREKGKRLLNPLVLFCSGIAWLMELPLFILSETKVISTNRRAIITKGRGFSIMSCVFTFLTLLSIAITIIVGWEKFIEIVFGWMK